MILSWNNYPGLLLINTFSLFNNFSTSSLDNELSTLNSTSGKVEKLMKEENRGCKQALHNDNCSLTLIMKLYVEHLIHNGNLDSSSVYGFDLINNDWRSISSLHSAGILNC